mmetsp:Transcript_30099/g.68173  ORF Transcript_30099/g.68173 Transcript_30099/m.68173 type:complete len:241 (-) Transcript_30099:6-728(-)
MKFASFENSGSFSSASSSPTPMFEISARAPVVNPMEKGGTADAKTAYHVCAVTASPLTSTNCIPASTPASSAGNPGKTFVTTPWVLLGVFSTFMPKGNLLTCIRVIPSAPSTGLLYANALVGHWIPIAKGAVNRWNCGNQSNAETGVPATSTSSQPGRTPSPNAGNSLGASATTFVPALILIPKGLLFTCTRNVGPSGPVNGIFSVALSLASSWVAFTVSLRPNGGIACCQVSNQLSELT